MSHVAVFENERASNYDQFVDTWIPRYQYLLNLLPDLVITHAGQRQILMAGCGTGNEIKVFNDRLPRLEITGIDPSHEMIIQAMTRFADQENIRLVEGQVKHLSPKPVYDAATLLLVLHFMPDDGTKLNLLKDIAQRLKPGARLVLVDIFGTASELKKNLEVLRHMLPKGLEAEAVNERLQRIEKNIQYIPERRLKVLLEAAGFEPPNRFYQAAIYGGWITHRTTKKNGLR